MQHDNALSIGTMMNQKYLDQIDKIISSSSGDADNIRAPYIRRRRVIMDDDDDSF